MGWRIRSDGQGRGLFHTYTALPGWRWPADLTHADGVALQVRATVMAQGRRPRHFYVLQVCTVADQWVQAIVDQAEEAVAAQIAPADQALARAARVYFLDRPDGSAEVVSIPALPLPSLGERTVGGAKAAWLRAHWDTLAQQVNVATEVVIAPVNPKARRAGVAVRLITAEPNLTVAAMARIIANFRAHGEAAQPPVPAPFEPHRPIVEAMLRAQLWRWDREEALAHDQVVAEPTDPQVRAAFGYASSPVRRGAITHPRHARR